MQAALEFYSKIKCKGRQGYPCQFQGWCVNCGNLEWDAADLQCIDDFSSANFNHSSQLQV